MKKILLIISFFTISFCYSQDWEIVTKQENGDFYYKPNTDETAWIKIVSDKTEYYPSKTSSNTKTVDGYKIVLWKYDCTDKKIGIIKSTTYSKDGKVLENFSQKEYLVEMDYVNPETLGEALLLHFCK